MKKIYRKILLISVFMIMFSVILLENITAQQISASSSIYDAVVPKPQTLETKDDLGVNLFSGAATYSYPLTVPPGTNGVKPNLVITYNSHSAGQRGVLESGWSLTESYIQRDTNYTVENTADDEFTLMLEGVPYELIHNKTNNRFHTAIESFMYIQNVTGGENDNAAYWRVRTKDGTTYRFGYYNFSEQLSNQYNYTSRWYLDVVNNTNNVSLFYTYAETNYRLSEIETTGNQDLDYLYDNVGNVIEINDSANNLNYSMQYDALNRLIATDILGATTVSLDFIYDAIGNLRNVTGTYPAHYTYQDSRPHATSSIRYY